VQDVYHRGQARVNRVNLSKKKFGPQIWAQNCPSLIVLPAMCGINKTSNLGSIVQDFAKLFRMAQNLEFD
jgi:hypothetical protein